MNPKLVLLVALLSAAAIASTASNEDLDLYADAAVRDYFSEDSRLVNVHHADKADGSVRVELKYNSGLQAIVAYQKNRQSLSLVEYHLPKLSQ